MRPIADLHIVPKLIAHVKTIFKFFREIFSSAQRLSKSDNFAHSTRYILPLPLIYLRAKELMGMAMAYLWTGMVVVSLFFGASTGNWDALGTAALEGAQSAVELCFAMCGVMCLWTGLMEVMNQCALTDRLAALFRCSKGFCRARAVTAKRSPPFPPTSRPIFSALATQQRRSASAQPAA